jgi:class 3 adenylate cyclase
VRGPDDPLLRAEGDEGVHGLVRTSEGLVFLGAHPIVRSDGSGPSRGTLLLGRALDDAEILRIAERIDLDATTVSLDGELPADIAERRSAIEALGPEGVLLDPLEPETLGAYALIADVRGEPAAVLRVRVPRTVYLQGRSDANFIAVSVGLACLAFGLMMLVLLDRFIVRRVTSLGLEVGEVALAADHSLRVSESGEDELGRLARTVNQMLASLERLNVELEDERAKAERLLHNVLPEPIAERLKRGEQTIADAFDEVSVLFADIVGFTDLSSKIPASELVVLLNEVFSAFDALAEKHGLEKIKTIGDAYMVVAGLPSRRDDHAVALSTMALDMLDAIADFNAKHGTSLGMRIGINSGPVVAGVIGKRKFIYDLWGDAVNTASRMESSGVPGRVQVSASTAARLEGKVPTEDRGVVTVKGKGDMRTYLLAERAKG